MLVLAFTVTTSAYAQSTATVTGVVKDSAGGVIPGATVVVKQIATGRTFEAVSGSNGEYVVPALQAGAYSVSATLTGFKTAQVNDVRVGLGTPSTVNLTLEVGQLSETVNVTSSTELINTQTATVTATLNSDQLNRMPTPTRNALNAVAFLPGVNTTGTNRDSTINGLPDSFVQITMDGASNNDNFLRSSDGFFASVTPRQDAVEAVTVTMAAAGANLGGSGAVTIAFQTRSGGNRFSGSLYEYYRNPKLNTNYIFNEINGLPKNDVKLHQYGGRVGGPIVIPGVYDGRGKAFFFANYEQIRFPNTLTRTRTVMPSTFIDGNFQYPTTTGLRTVNILTLAASLGHLSTTDPTVIALLRNIDKGVASSGVRNPTLDPVYDSYVFQSPSKLFEHQPTGRIDYNITDKHRLTMTAAVIQATRDADYLNGGDRTFPGAINYSKFTSIRPLYTATMRSTLTSNLVNEFRMNLTALGGTSYFGSEESNGRHTYEDQDFYRIILPGDWTDWTTQNGPSWRSSPTYLIGNTLTYQRGSHSFSFGAEWQRATANESAQTIVPTVTLGFSTDNDPAASMFVAANFPGISTGDLGDARNLYAALTGRVSNVSGQAVLNGSTGKYELFQPRTRQGYMDTFSGFIQDSWRMTPTVTLTAGLRYDLQMPFTPSNDIMTTMSMEDACGQSGLGDGSVFNRCNFFSPGFNSGNVGAELYILGKGVRGYDTDYNNLSPSISLAWRPNVQSGILRTILGDPDQATLRAGYSMSTAREGLSAFTGVFGANRGSTLALSRTAGNGLLVPAGSGESWPVLFRDRGRLGQAPFPESPTFPIQMAGNRTESVQLYAPGFTVGRGQTWTAGIQRAVGSDMAIEFRYLGTKGSDQRSDLNYNGINGDTVVGAGYFEEFKLAMANLAANNAAGGSRVGSFAYFGANTGTNPLPITLGHLNGRTDATNPAAYTGGTATWTSTGIAGNLTPHGASPTGMAGQLVSTLARRNFGIAAGYPANMFLTNPYLNTVTVWDSGAFSDYHALQIEVRRRLSKGLSASGSYQYAIERGSAFDGFSNGRTMVNGAAVRHAIKGQWDWTLPVGRGQRFGSDMHPLIDGILGGWSLNGVARIQARVMNFGNVRLVGMTLDELTDMYKYRTRVNAANGNLQYYMLPEDVILNTRRAFSASTTTANFYSSTLGAPEGRYIAPANQAGCIQLKAGDCAPRSLLVRAPWFSKIDMGITKRFNVRGTANFEVRADVLNVFDAINLNPVANPGSGATIFTATSGYTDPSNTYDPGGRIGQLMIRFNW